MEDDVETPEGFAAWYASEHPRVLASVCVAAGDVDVAGEITAEAFARALERWSRVAQMARPGGWTTVTALNLLKRRRRREALERALVRRQHAELAAPPPSLPTDLWDAVRELPPRMRTAVALRYVADLPERQVAEAMGVSAGTVASTLHDARQRLRTALSDDPMIEV